MHIKIALAQDGGRDWGLLRPEGPARPHPRSDAEPSLRCTIYPVSRSVTEVQGRKAYASVAELPQPTDLAILFLPAQFVPEALERRGRAGVRAAVLLSSGFAEKPGAADRRTQQAICESALKYVVKHTPAERRAAAE